MKDLFQNRLAKHIEELLSRKVIGIKTPPQGMTSKVFFIEFEDKKGYAVKYGEDAMNDVPAFELIEARHINIPVPKLIKHLVFEEVPVVILEKVEYPLLDSINVKKVARYIPSMIKNLRELHKVKSQKPGLLIEPDSKKTWKEMILSIFEGREFDWNEIASRKGVDGVLILESVKRIIEKIKNTKFIDRDFSFLHTDFNQRNLFVDPNSDKITGIIDWEEAMFGDPIYDFARIRMFLWHFNLGDEVVENYYKILSYTEEEKDLEELYCLSRTIQYLDWYSEELNDFNSGRITLHQDYLRNYKW